MNKDDLVKIKYDNAVQAIRALARMRRYGLGSPVDHAFVELGRLAFFCVPVFLLFTEVILPREMLAFFAGYFFLRWFDRYLKPRILAATGPAAFRGRTESPITVQLDAYGVRSESNYGSLTLGWNDVPPPRVFRSGVLIRVYEEQSIAIDANLLPDGLTPDALGQKIRYWQEASA